MFVNNTNPGDAPFNMAMMYYVRLNELLSAKDKAAITSDITSYYACLNAVYNNVYFKIKDEPKCYMVQELLDRSYRILGSPGVSDKAVMRQAMAMNFEDARKNLIDADKLLMILLDKKGMIFPRINVTQGINALRKSMGLNDEGGD